MVTEAKFEKQFTYVIFPFTTKANFTDIEDISVQHGESKTLKVWLPKPVILTETQSEFRCLFDMDGGSNNIAKHYELNPNVRKDFGLRNRNLYEVIVSKNEKEPPIIELLQINLWLFENNVGFFTLKFAYNTNSVEDYLLLSNVLAEPKRKDFCLYIHSNENQKSEVRLLDLLKQMLANFIEIEDFDYKPGLHYADCRPLVFSYLLLQDKLSSDAMNQLLFHARLNYKTSYKAIHSLNGTYDAFENSHWGVSLNGAVNVSKLTGDPITDKFFREVFPLRLEGTYLAIYLSVLNQYFTIQYLKRQYLTEGKYQSNHSACGKKEDLEKLGNEERKNLEKASKFLASLNDQARSFELRSFYLYPSHVPHVNGYANLLNLEYSIRDKLEELKNCITKSQEIFDQYKERIISITAAEKDIKKTRIEILIYVLLTVIGFCGTFKTAYDFVTVLSGVNIYGTPLFAIPCVLLLIPLTALILTFILKIREYRAKRERYRKLLME